MDASEALALAERAVASLGGRLRVEVDDEGDLVLSLRKDMIHLDADALHDRLHHWTLTELRRSLPAASATVSFRNARPEDPFLASELDLQEGWRDLEPMLRLEMRPPPSRGDVEAFLALVPRFLRLADGAGRPEGFRHHEVGSQE